MGDVLILGAGFSHAIDSRMPVTDTLGSLCRGIVTEPNWAAAFPGNGFNNGYFEAWLSRRAENQPDLSEEENLFNRSLAIRITAAIAEVLRECQATAMIESGPGGPQWLSQLLQWAHRSNATLITFNYDTLIEAAVGPADLRYPETGPGSRPIAWQDVIDHIPPLIRGAPSFNTDWATSIVRSFELLKLHGSLNWYWSPDDHAATGVARWSYVGEFGTNRRDNDRTRDRLTVGQVPFIVPPASAKSGYYQNRLVRRLWEKAHRALTEADRVVLVGYSMPLTDFVFAGMFWETVGVRDTPVEVVNLSADSVITNLEKLGVKSDSITSRFAGTRCILDFVSSLVPGADSLSAEQ